MTRASLVAQSLQNLAAMQDMRVQSLVWEDPVLRFMGLQRVSHDWATELNWTWRRKWLPTLVFLPRTEETGRLQSMGWQKSQHNLSGKPPLPWWQRVINLLFPIYRWTVWIQTSLHSFTNWFGELGNSFNLASQLPHLKNVCMC